MSPKSRERDYARRRYEDWQRRQNAKAAESAALRRRAAIAIGAVVVTLGLVGAVAIMAGGSDDTSTTAATSGSPGSSAPADASAAADANNPCAPPGDALPADLTFPDPPAASQAQGRSWNLALETTCGQIGIVLDGAKAPQAVASTVFLSGKKFYDNTRCHRLTTKGIFVLQCGDPLGSGGGGPGYSYGPVENAPADNVYPAGTVAMARQGGKGDSMGSQFFLVYKDSTIPSDKAGGYSVIGTIVGGMDVVEKVAAGGVLGGGTDGAPARAISITATTVS
ncbi:MAG: peptidylprolyl isomerase [Kineosporiaceae bacterium]|nr:peptidylprolyl isomerase [Kineosporiaceae bacterium]